MSRERDMAPRLHVSADTTVPPSTRPVAWGTLPERSLLPPHHRDCGDTIEGRPLNDPRAIRQIHERPVCQIDHTHNARLFEDERCPLTKHLGLFRELREINGNRPHLSTRDGEAGTILRHA